MGQRIDMTDERYDKLVKEATTDMMGKIQENGRPGRSPEEFQKFKKRMEKSGMDDPAAAAAAVLRRQGKV